MTAPRRGERRVGFEARLRREYPTIPWREPLPIKVPPENGLAGASGLACRICIADTGIKGSDVVDLPQTREEFDEHIRIHHPEPQSDA